MFSLNSIKSTLILKNNETSEEHFGKILDINKEMKKIRIQLLDEEKYIYYKRYIEIELIIPIETDIYHFKTSVIYYDIIDKIVTITYPEEVSEIIKRKYERFNLNIALDIVLLEHVIPSISYDLCVGGISFLANYTLILDNKIKIKIKVEEFKDDYFNALILNKKTFSFKGNHFLFYSAKFIDLSDEMSRKITDYLNKA